MKSTNEEIRPIEGEQHGELRDVIADAPKDTLARASNALIAPTNRRERRRSRAVSKKLIKKVVRTKKKVAARKERKAAAQA